MLSAGDFLPEGPLVQPFSICSDSARAIQALRDLADWMERGRVGIVEAQTGQKLSEAEQLEHVIFLRFNLKPW